MARAVQQCEWAVYARRPATVATLSLWLPRYRCRCNESSVRNGCQAGRAFVRSKKHAFYVNREIKPDVPACASSAATMWPGLPRELTSCVASDDRLIGRLRLS